MFCVMQEACAAASSPCATSSQSWTPYSWGSSTVARDMAYRFWKISSTALQRTLWAWDTHSRLPCTKVKLAWVNRDRELCCVNEWYFCNAPQLCMACPINPNSQGILQRKLLRGAVLLCLKTGRSSWYLRTGWRFILCVLVSSVCAQYLDKYPGDQDLLWEVEGIGVLFQRVRLSSRIQALALKGKIASHFITCVGLRGVRFDLFGSFKPVWNRSTQKSDH